MRTTALIVLSLALPAMGAAQAPDTSALRRLTASLQPGTTIRVELAGGRRWSGAFQAAGPVAFEFTESAGQRRGATYADVTRFWERKRAVGAGAITGGLAGAAGGAFLGLIVAGVCEYDCPGTGEAVLGVGLFGAALGAGAGAIIGAAIPRWQQRYRSSPGAGTPAAAPEPAMIAGPVVDAAPKRRVGEFSAFAVTGYGGFPAHSDLYGSYPEVKGATFGAEMGLGFRAGPLAIGPEVGLMSGEQTLWMVNGTVRAYIGDDRLDRALPYLVAGLGAVAWQADPYETQLLTLTLGLGAQLPSGWRLESRLHPMVQNAADPKPTLFTIAVGRRFVW